MNKLFIYSFSFFSFKYASDEDDDNMSSLTGSGSHGPTTTAVPAITTASNAGTTSQRSRGDYGELSPQHRRRKSRQPRSRGDPGADELSCDEDRGSREDPAEQPAQLQLQHRSQPTSASVDNRPASVRSVDIATNQKIMDLNNIVDSLIAENQEIRASLQEYKGNV